MARILLVLLIIASSAGSRLLLAQKSQVPEASGLKVELRSGTGSNRFQIGEVIPLDVFVSSSTPNHYLAPCALFRESCFGFPQCRYFSRWSVAISPEVGWKDLGPLTCWTMSGPTFPMPSHDLATKPEEYSYILTKRFRFEKPGKYTVRMTLDVGLDDATNELRKSLRRKIRPHQVSATGQIVLDIVEASEPWKKSVIEKGLAAWAAGPPRATNPPSPEMLRFQQETNALCNLGTPEAARALAGVLSRRQGDVTHCLRINPNRDVAIAEMQKLMADPTVGVSEKFFSLLVGLHSQNKDLRGGPIFLSRKVADTEREALFQSLPRKTESARLTSLVTILKNPPTSPGSPYAFPYPISFPTPVIRTVAANFDRLPEEEQTSLLAEGWDTVRSPLMLPVVRREAQKGNGQALLRWQELDPTAAIEFMREEIVRPRPRFSSRYIRLPDTSLLARKQIATNFIHLSDARELERAATLLHSYATRKGLPTVLPFIDQHLVTWPCELQIPVLAYLLKVSPDQAAPRVERVLESVKLPYCPRGEFLPDLGFLQPSPILDGLAAKQIEEGTRFAPDAAVYLRLYGSSAMKKIVWEQLSRWEKKYLESGAERRISEIHGTRDDRFLHQLTSDLLDAYVGAQAWVLSPQDSDVLKELLRNQKVTGLACSSGCSHGFSVGPTPGSFSIYGHRNTPVWPKESRVDYLMPTERLHYSVNQYHCASMKALKQKLLQFPRGSIFDFAWNFSERDRSEIIEISEFLRSNGYKVNNYQKWSFLDSPADR